MGYKSRMEPGAYEGLCRELSARVSRAREQIDSNARHGTLDQIRYHGGVRDGLDIALMILQGKKEDAI